MQADIRALFALDFDGGDPWGSTMSHWFAVAGTLYRHDGEIPSHWQYRAALGAGEAPDDWPETEYEEMVEESTITLADLTHAGNVLTRYASVLERAGHSY